MKVYILIKYTPAFEETKVIGVFNSGDLILTYIARESPTIKVQYYIQIWEVNSEMLDNFLISK